MHAFLFALLLLLVPFRASCDFPNVDNPEQVQWAQTRIRPFVVVTIPGSGTHLLEKALFYLDHSIPRWHFNHPYQMTFGFQLDPNYPHYLLTHFWMSRRTEELHQALQLKKIICIRDLRDVCVTIAHKMRGGEWPGFNWHHSKALKAFQDLSFDEQLLFVINYEYEPADIKDVRQFSLPLVAEQAIEYMQDPDVLVVRYENLVGEKGNGTKEAQIIELRRLAEVLKLALTDEKLEEIAANLHGDHPDNEKRLKFADPQITFRKGKTKSWMGAFKEEHKQAFKKKFGNALILMGYEENTDW